MKFSDEQELRWYLDTFNDDDDRIWCGCGDEIVHGPPHHDPVYYDARGQYCCELCAELKWWKENGIKSFGERLPGETRKYL